MRHRLHCLLLTLLLLTTPWTLAQAPAPVRDEAKPAPPAAAAVAQAEAAPRPEAPKDLKSTVAPPLTIEQIRNNLPLAPADKFEFLRNQRKTTLEAISGVASLLDSVDTKIASLRVLEEASQMERGRNSAETAKEDLAMAKEELATAQKRVDTLRASGGAKAADALSRAELDLDSRKRYLNSVQGWLTENEAKEKAHQERTRDLTRLRAERADLSATQLSYQRLLGSIDDMVNQLFIASDATNSFKLRMSIAFSALVGVVIIGFFAIAWSNDDIKKTIFANEAGIQFITIFSIVIAVILFGIIGVLESKELSALLGGLSGYILGKSRA